jgi:hypothetical protein
MAGTLKGFTGHEANRLLGRNGAFWQDESYHHLGRDSTSFERIRNYIEWNPVKAGLAGTPERDAARKGGGHPKGLTPHVSSVLDPYNSLDPPKGLNTRRLRDSPRGLVPRIRLETDRQARRAVNVQCLPRLPWLAARGLETLHPLQYIREGDPGLQA